MLRNTDDDTSQGFSNLTGVRALQLAVLEDGGRAYLYRGKGETALRQQKEAESWLNDPRDWVYGFETICSELNLNPDFVRKGLRQMRARNADPLDFRLSPNVTSGQRELAPTSRSQPESEGSALQVVTEADEPTEPVTELEAAVA